MGRSLDLLLAEPQPVQCRCTCASADLDVDFWRAAGMDLGVRERIELGRAMAAAGWMP